MAQIVTSLNGGDNRCGPTGLVRLSAGTDLPPPELGLPSFQKRRDAFLVILGQARERELVEVHMGREIVERVGQPVDGQALSSRPRAATVPPPRAERI